MIQRNGTRSPRRSVLAALVAAAALAGALNVTPASGASAAPSWSIDAVAVPTNLVPGDESGNAFYELTAVNNGGAATNGSPITITDRLPAGLSVKQVVLNLRASMVFGGSRDYAGEACETEEAGGASTVRCIISEELLEAVESTVVIGPSEQIKLQISFAVPASATGTLENLASVTGGGASTASATARNEASAEPASSGLSYFRSDLTDEAGRSVTKASSHPYQYTTSFALNTEPGLEGTSTRFQPAGGNAKDIQVALPPGLIGNPNAVSRCSAQQFITTHTNTGNIFQNDCPDGSVVGLALIQQLEGEIAGYAVPVYNLAPPVGMPAQLGFRVAGAPFYVNTKVRTGTDYGITGYLPNTSEVKRVTAASVTLWGTPAAVSHDPLRGSCMNAEKSLSGAEISLGSCSAGLTARPFLRLPTSCAASLNFEMSFNTWPTPASFASLGSGAAAPKGCASLDFSPSISAVPTTTVADSASGLSVNLHLPQNEDPTSLAEADLRDATVTLPNGVTVNPASAGGLAGCSSAQVDLKSEAPANCPDASKIGSVEVHTPLLDHPLKGGVYVASQGDNPFNSLIAIYIAAYDPQTGVVLKLAGHVVPDPTTGQLRTTFADNPQLPFEDLTVNFFEGPRAPLRTPGTCGTFATTTGLKPWSAPESGLDATPTDSFTVSTAPRGKRCAASEANQPNDPSFSAGTITPLAATHSPFVMHLAREDGSQTLRGLNLTLPPGLVAKLAGVPYCPDSELAAAAAKAGATEQASSTCPGASQVGIVNVGAGAGPSPFYAQGKVYLAGPYKEAPISLAIVTPAVAGPFDLGTVVVRAALHVDPTTAQVSAVSDPIPTILQGIPLDVRSVAVSVDRPDFTLNPTNCAPMSVSGEAISLAGQIAPLSDHFQVGGCRGLDFAPKLSLRLKGGTKRGAYPKLRAVLQAKKGEANIGRVSVALPHSEFLAQEHINTICTRVQFAADRCPLGSIYGHARAITPLLDKPLEGPVYLRSSSNLLPDLVAALHGQVDIDLVGRVDSINAGIRNTFSVVPDAPVSKFVLNMKGGKKSLLVNSRNLCKSTNKATVRMVGQNGKAHNFRPVLRNQCAKKGRHK